MAVQRVVQGLSLCLFLLALLQAPDPLLSFWPADGFQRMDPVAGLGTLLAGRQWVPHLWIAVLILLLAPIWGRFFCAYLCPMGTTIDFTDRLLRGRRRRRTRRPSDDEKRAVQSAFSPDRRLKYQVLCVICGAGVMGVSFVFLASPLSLITRFYGIIIYPVLAFLADQGLDWLRPAADRVNLTTVAYAMVKVPRYGLQEVTLATMLAIFAGGLWVPRFWCRCICPAGALLALFAKRPLLRRRVSRDCSDCRLCSRVCPMNAIGSGSQANGGSDVRVTLHTECLACQACVRACPAGAVSFVARRQPAPIRLDGVAETISIGRRRFLGAGMCGAAAGIITLTGVTSPHRGPGPGSIIHPAMIRPPGALPEHAFLARCIRCGLCMHACPTNSLQPLGLVAGFSAWFSPVVTPRRGPCDPGCNACGRVCPTGAIAPLPLVEKLTAKVGTARISRQQCLAWELEKKCLICDEVCPFDAIEFRRPDGRPIAVPFVNGNRCAGCGYCEHFCPVRATPAITVTPMLALRLMNGSYRAAARERGYTLELGDKRQRRPAGHSGLPTVMHAPLDENGLPPGFTE